MKTKIWSWMFVFLFVFGVGIALADKGPCVVTIPADFEAGGCGDTVNSCPPDIITYEQSECDNSNEDGCTQNNNAPSTEIIFYNSGTGIDCYYQDPVTLAEYYWSCVEDLANAVIFFGGTAC